MTTTKPVTTTRFGFWPGFSTGIFIPLVVGAAIGLAGLGQPWFGVASVVQLTGALVVLAALPRWRMYAAGALAGFAVFPALGVVWILLTSVFLVGPMDSSPDIDRDAFLTAVRAEVPAFDDYSDDELTDMADVACSELASVPAMAVIDWPEEMAESDREHLVYLALTEGCPEESHSGRGA